MIEPPLVLRLHDLLWAHEREILAAELGLAAVSAGTLVGAPRCRGLFEVVELAVSSEELDRFCSLVCGARARSRRQRAARLLEYADRIAAGAGVPSLGSSEYVLGRAASVRRMGVDLLASIGEAP